MAVNDRIRVQRSTFFNDPATEPPVVIYNVPTTPEGEYILNKNGFVSPEPVGGVKVGTEGIIIGQPCKAYRTDLKGYETNLVQNVADPIMLFPVKFIQYNRMAWIPADFYQVVG